MTEKDQEKLAKIKNSPWSFFINRRPVAWLLVIAIIAFGLTAVMGLPREMQPEIDIPIASVATMLPGASPSDTESLITEPLEKEIATISDIKSLSSSSGFGSSIIMIEFEANTDLTQAIQELKDAVDKGKSELPEDATEPMVVRAEANEFSIITFSLIGDRPLYELTEIAETIQDELEKISGVSSIDLVGGQKKEIRVTLDQKKVEGFGLNIQDISSIIKLSNHNLPIGITQIENLNYSIRVDNLYKDLSEIRDIPIITINQTSPPTTIFLKDIASVEELYPDESRITKFSIDGQESKRTISLRVNKKSGTNLIEIADASKEKIEELQNSELIPDDVEISVSNDNSFFIRTDLGILTKNGIQTTGLIILLLFLALGLKEGLIAGLSIPLTFLVAFIIMDLTGSTINSLSLFSLVIALGLMVDTAIVIMEGIHENLKKGYTPKESAMLSVDTYKWPLIAGTLTTIFAFVPMLLVSGMLGQFLKTLPITISAALFGSLFISLTIGPSISVKFLKTKSTKKYTSILEPMFKWIGKMFHKFIHGLIKRRIFRFLTILISLVLFAASMALPITGQLAVEMFPKTDVPYFIVDIEAPKGIIIEETEKATEKAEEIVYNIPEVKSFLTIIGSSQAQAYTDIIEVGGGTSSNVANITVNLIPSEEREKRSYEISEELRKEFKKITDSKITIREITEGPPTEAPINIKINGEELDVLQEIATKVEEIIESIPETTNINTTLTPGLNEFKFTLDRNKLSYHGLSAMQVSGTIRNALQGINSTEIKLGGEELDIIVKYDLLGKNNTTVVSIDELKNFKIQSPKGYAVSLGELGNYELGESLSSISREEQKRVVKVRSDVTKDGNAVAITKEIQEKLEDYEIPKGYELQFAGDLDDIAQSFNELYISMSVGILLIIFTLVLMFNSFKQPFIVIFTLPLALIGVFPGLMSVGLNLSFPAFLGVVALSGVVVNDAIVLIDRINNNRKEGIEFKEAIAEAANARLQPIVMTTITTVVGILPLAISNEFWAGLGFSLVFGLSCATMLTLVVMPVLYYMLEVRQDRKMQKLKQQRFQNDV